MSAPKTNATPQSFKVNSTILARPNSQSIPKEDMLTFANLPPRQIATSALLTQRKSEK